jgi:hypothetical protein
MPASLAELFPDRDYRFHLTLRKGDVAEFFGGRTPAVLAERKQWLGDDPAHYIVGEADDAPLLSEAEALLVSGRETGSVVERLVRLGSSVEPDVVLMARDGAGVFRLRAGAVCFPSSWALTEKFGLTLDEIHGVVPGLNSALAPAIGQFLDKLKPGAPFERANWGLAATSELNMHPSLMRPRLGPTLDVARTWVRIEYQILAAMPVTGGILFGIDVKLVPLADLLGDPALRAGLHRAVVTMPDALAVYKGLAPVRSELIRLAGAV